MWARTQNQLSQWGNSYYGVVLSAWVVPIHSFFFHFLSLIIYFKYRPNLHHWLYFIKKGRHQLQSYVEELRITFAKHRGMTVSSMQWADLFSPRAVMVAWISHRVLLLPPWNGADSPKCLHYLSRRTIRWKIGRTKRKRPNVLPVTDQRIWICG